MGGGHLRLEGQVKGPPDQRANGQGFEFTKLLINGSFIWLEGRVNDGPAPVADERFVRLEVRVKEEEVIAVQERKEIFGWMD